MVKNDATVHHRRMENSMNRMAFTWMACALLTLACTSKEEGPEEELGGQEGEAFDLDGSPGFEEGGNGGGETVGGDAGGSDSDDGLNDGSEQDNSGGDGDADPDLDSEEDTSVPETGGDSTGDDGDGGEGEDGSQQGVEVSATGSTTEAEIAAHKSKAGRSKGNKPKKQLKSDDHPSGIINSTTTTPKIAPMMVA